METSGGCRHTSRTRGIYIYTYMCIYICISREYPRDEGMGEGEGGVQGPAALETG